VTAENGGGDVDKRVLDEWRTAAYNCFSSGHKFCREVCPVLQVTYVNCTQCGACELRCPNTIFAGDFYRIRTRTVDLVKASECPPARPRQKHLHMIESTPRSRPQASANVHRSVARLVQEWPAPGSQDPQLEARSADNNATMRFAGWAILGSNQ
jgi:ferredoxin